MAGMNAYPNLPGHNIELKNGGLALRNETVTARTNSVLLLGTSLDGPVMEPVSINMNTLKNTFGSEVTNGLPNGSTLVKRAQELYIAGCRDIRCMRVTGSVASAILSKNSVTTNVAAVKKEYVGIAEGNEETTISLAKAPIDNVAVVTIGGVQATTGFTVSSTQVVFNANVANAGSLVNINYNTNSDVDVVDATAVVSADFKVTMPEVVKSLATTSAKLKSDGSPVGVVSVTDKEILLDEADVVEGDEVLITYKYVVVTPVVVSGQLVAGDQEFVLSETFVSGLKVYANGVLISDAGAATATGTTVTINKRFFNKGASVSVAYTYNKTNTVTETMSIKTVSGGEIYNKAAVAVDSLTTDEGVSYIQLTLTKPQEKRASNTELPLVYSSLKYPTLGLLCNAINNDFNNKLFVATTDFPNGTVVGLNVNTSSTNSLGVLLTGGTDGLNPSKEDLFKALSGERDAQGYIVKEGAYQLLEDYSVDNLVVLDAFADDELDDPQKNFAYELALACAIYSYRNKACHGFIDKNACINTSLAGIKGYVEGLLLSNNTYIMRDPNGSLMLDSEGNYMDIGGFVSVCVGPEPVIVSNKVLGAYYGSPACMYAGLDTILKPQSAATNKQIPGAKGLKYKFSNSQLNDLVGKGYVCFKNKYNAAGQNVGDVYVVSAITAGLAGSDFKNRTTAKIVQVTSDTVRNACEPFIGEPSEVENINAMASAVSKKLSILKENGVIGDYEFQLIQTVNMQLLGQMQIELKIATPIELKEITTILRLTV
jgi:hypothetical protein